MTDPILSAALAKLKAGEPLGAAFNQVVREHLRKLNDMRRKEYEAKLENYQIQGGALEAGGRWHIDWERSYARQN